MTTKNPYRKKSHLWTKQTRKIVHYFCEDLTATKTSSLLWIQRNTINSWYHYMRQAIMWDCLATDKQVRKWIIEIDESYFWPKRIKWKRWRWASNKVKVLWLLKRHWNVFIQIVPNCSAKHLIPVIRWKVDTDSIVNTDGRKAYDWLIDLWYRKHWRVHHSKDEFARWPKHINGIESFRSYTKRRLAKFNGIPKENFSLYLKECEFRFNCRLQKENMYKKLLQILRRFTFE